MFVPLKRRGMSRRPRVLDVLERKSSPSDATCPSQKGDGKWEMARRQVLADLAEFADMKRARIQASVGTVIKCGLQKCGRSGNESEWNRRDIGRALMGKYIYRFTLKDNQKSVANIFSKRFKADFYTAREFIMKIMKFIRDVHSYVYACRFTQFQKNCLETKN